MLSVTDKNGMTPFLAAIFANQKECADYFVDNKLVDVNQKDNTGRAMLHFIAHQGNVAAAELLCSYGADLNIRQDGTRSTPLHIAVKQKNKNFVQFLLETKKDRLMIDAEDCNKNTPFKIAMTIRASELAQMLLMHGASNAGLNSGFEGGALALRIALAKGDVEAADEISSQPTSSLPAPAPTRITEFMSDAALKRGTFGF